MTDYFDTPAVVMAKQTAIENDLAERQNAYEKATREWYAAQREINRVKAATLLTSKRDSVTEKKAEGELAAYDVQGAASEAEYEALKAVIRVLEQRSMILASLLKSQAHS